MDAEDKAKIKSIIEDMVRVDKENVDAWNCMFNFRSPSIEDHIWFTRCRSSLAFEALARVGMVLAGGAERKGES